MKAIIVMFDTLRKQSLPCYGNKGIIAPNFERLAEKTVTFDNFYAGSLPCIPARREMHTGRYNFLHRSWGPLEPFDESVYELLKKQDIYSHLITDHAHYLEDGGATYHNRFNTWECFRGQEGDRWKPQIETIEIPKQLDTVKSGVSFKQNWINRSYQEDEANTSMARVFESGLEFLDNNCGKDKWLLQIETFNPHEPFDVPQKYMDMYEDIYEGDWFDWPSYQPVTEDPEAIDHLKLKYAAMVTMCDEYLGRILDRMDACDLWKDTMLIVNTDHGFLLSEHQWWGKNIQPFYNEISELPFFMYNPESGGQNLRRNALCQTIDIPATLLDYFGGPEPEHMQGKSLLKTLEDDCKVRDSALFGMHGGHVNIVDEAHVYMRASVTPENGPLYQYTLMPTNIRNFFKKQQLKAASLTDTLAFTDHTPVLKVPTASFLAPYRFGHRLYDNINDRKQMTPLDDVTMELELLEKLRCKLIEAEAPLEQYERLGLYRDRNLSVEELIEQRKTYSENAQTSLCHSFEIDEKALRQLLTLKQFMMTGARDSFEVDVRQSLQAKNLQWIDEEVVMGLFEEFSDRLIPAKKAMLKKIVRFAYLTD